MALKIYTKTGDKGKTSLIGGTKVPKSHSRIASYGTVDELNSFIGLLNDTVTAAPVHDSLREIQDRLFTIGSLLATAPGKKISMELPDLKEEDVLRLEEKIDAMDKEIAPLKFFILPGGHVTVSNAHICRSVCRRAERCCVQLQEEDEYIDPLIIKYLNRLSDYFFVLARWLAAKLNVAEIKWTPRR
jgi:cob(I)alamin adenosyltransferase